MSDSEMHASAEVDAFRMTPRTVRATMWVGLSSAIVGVITGLTMLLQRRVVDCPDGTYFPNGTKDFRCFEHPLALEGTAVAALAISVGALILLTGFAATRPTTPTAAAPTQAATE